jgi:large subunit ribosomal protein L4e
MKFKINGEEREIELPKQFEEDYRPDLIKRAFEAYSSQKYQPKSSYKYAGLQNIVEYYGRRAAWRATINTGRSRVPREKIAKGRSGRVLRIPSAVKGRRAHPPKTEKILKLKINKKEQFKAMRSAMSATIHVEVVKKRGHSFKEIPLIVPQKIEEIKKTKELKKYLSQLGIEQDLTRSENRKKRSGVSLLRRGGYKTRKTALVVVGGECPALKAGANIPGATIKRVELLNINDLAPGGVAGRLTVWSESAIKKIKELKLFE